MRLLLAEDERELSRALVTVLAKQNYSIDAVFDGQEALDYLAADNYDAAILDIMMPKVDGITVLKTLREQGNQIPVLLLTAKSEINDRVVGLDSGADDYLTKPFSMKELLARLRVMTRRKREGRADNDLSFGNVTLDRAGSELRTAERTTSLGNREFQLIELLISNPEQYLSVERLFEKIWGYDSEADLSVVWVNVSNLRKKLAQLGADVTIRAKRNTGYRLEKLDD